MFTQSAHGLSFGKAAWGAVLGALLLALAIAVPAAAGWTGVTALSSATVPVEEPPDAAIDADGDSYHVWIDKNQQVQSRVRSATGVLRPIVKLSSGSTLSPPPASDATVGVNARGDALFAWVSLNTAGTQNLIMCRARTAAGTLGPVQTCLAQSKDLGAILDPQVALDADGDGVIAWHQEGASSQIMVKTRSSTGQLGSPKIVAGSLNVEATEYEVEMDNGGEAVFVYAQNTATVEGQIQARVLSPTGTFAAPKTIASPQAEHPALAVNPRGDAAFTWARLNALTGKPVVEGRVLTDDNVLKRTVKLSSGDTEVTEPDVDIANSGAAVFTWGQKSLTVGKIQQLGRSLSATNALGQTKTLSGTTTDVFHGYVGVDATGNALFVWEDKDATTGKPALQSRKLTAAGALGPVVKVAALETQPYDLQLEVAGNGKAATVWRNTALKRVEAAYGP